MQIKIPCVPLIILPMAFFLTCLSLCGTSMTPKGMGLNESTTCEEFTKSSRFNPYSVTGVWWFMFFYWAPPLSPVRYYFFTPTTSQVKYLHSKLDGKVSVPLNWTARHVVVTTPQNATALLVERGDRGEYWLYVLAKDHPENEIVDPLDIRIRQSSDNKYILILFCYVDQAFLLSRFDQIPLKKDIPDIVARMGYRGRRGRSYLYQGHEWMPIPEMEDKLYWMPPRLKNKLQHRLKHP